ncbi:MAG TPA: CDP-6-deoxy-delta-3,4-glucoseen reductase [Stellaceae bacterium]|jgi:CDP-4-dehydro-6-deoxyglucose reductase|nr:CDP-6-deoxy-delta-3,4-glucoseen reductase [Stellaceae bacterium]
MRFNVTLSPSGHRFEAAEGRNVLASALEAGFNLPYSCRAGGCSTCKAHILAGKVDHALSTETYLPQALRDQGFALLCQAKPLSDLTIEIEELALHLAQPNIVPCRVKQIRRLAPDVVALHLRTPYNDNMLFAAGQYIDFLLADGKRRSYSIANAPMLEGGMMDLEIHIRHSPGGLFTDRVFAALKPNEVLRFEGPFGTFYLREESAKPIVFLASGTGFGPIKAIIEYALHRKISQQRPMALYWGCRARQDLYLLDLPERWAREAPNFRFVPVLSDALPEDKWTGRTGFVHRAVMDDFADLSGHQVYACGAPAMVDAARRDFGAQCGLPTGEFFADAFLTEAELAAAS